MSATMTDLIMREFCALSGDDQAACLQEAGLPSDIGADGYPQLFWDLWNGKWTPEQGRKFGNAVGKRQDPWRPSRSRKGGVIKQVDDGTFLQTWGSNGRAYFSVECVCDTQEEGKTESERMLEAYRKSNQTDREQVVDLLQVRGLMPVGLVTRHDISIPGSLWHVSTGDAIAKDECRIELVFDVDEKLIGMQVVHG